MISKAPSQGRTEGLIQYSIAILATHSTKARMEIIGYPRHLTHGNVSGQQGVHSSLELGQRVFPPGDEADDLPYCMNPGVCPPGADHPRFRAGDLRQRPFYLALNGPPFSLPLKAKVISTVILDDGHNTPSDLGLHRPFYSTNSKTTIGAPSPCRRPSL